MICLVGTFTVYFHMSNRQQKHGKRVLEGLVCNVVFFFIAYKTSSSLDFKLITSNDLSITARIPVHLLITKCDFPWGSYNHESKRKKRKAWGKAAVSLISCAGN